MAALLAASVAHAGDWPMWRYDAARSAATPEELPDSPVLLWSRKLPPVRPAWPLEPNRRIDFDVAYEPVVIGKLLFIGSPNDGSVTAYDTETGAERWTFYTEGPVRGALACWSNRVYAGSDDGWLYCLDAATGRQLWKFRGAPADRRDRRHLGNGHLVSFWPVRGGPVVRDGVVYFAAGLWPILGVFVDAVDAETGQPRWSNGELNRITGGPGECETGLSPQGNLGLLGNTLLVPNGRALPAALEADTGRLLRYTPGLRRGECRIALHSGLAFVGEHGLLDLKTGGEVATRQVTLGMHYKLVPACSAASAFADGIAYGTANGAFYAYDLTRVNAGERDVEVGGSVVRNVFRWEPLLRWQFPTPYQEPPRLWTAVNRPGLFGYVHGNVDKSKPTIKAGKRIYSVVGRKLICLADLDGPPRIAWEKSVEGTLGSLIAADGKLFVTTTEGTLYCFGAGTPGLAHEAQAVPLTAGSEAASSAVRDIVNAAGVKTGYCVVLGVGDGTLVETLLKQTELGLLVVGTDAEQIQALRKRCQQAGLLGERVQFFMADPSQFEFPPYLASLIVSAVPWSVEQIRSVDVRRLFEILRPYGGTLCLRVGATEHGIWEDRVRAAQLPKAVVKRVGDVSLLIRDGALPGAAPWSHMGCDAANTFCSQDDLVRAPLGILWYGDVPTGAPGEWHSIINMAVNGGRVFQTHGRAILAYDAYTGRFLWNKSLPGRHRFSAAVAEPDALYFVASDECVVLDPETGEVRQTFKLGINETQMAVDIRLLDDHILVVCRDEKDPSRGPYYRTMSEIGSLLICLDRKSGAERWRREAQARFHGHALAMGAGRVFCVDSQPIVLAEKGRESTEPLRELASTVLCLDAQNGKVLWSDTVRYDATRTFTPEEYAAGVEDRHIARLEADDWLAYSGEAGLVVAGRFLLGHAWEAQSGKRVWGPQDIRGSAPLMVRGKTLVTSGGDVHDLLTGQRIGNYRAIRKRSCNYAIASKHLVLIRGAGDPPVTASAAYYDVAQDRAYRLLNLRSSCRNNQLPADGLLNSPCYTPGDCICNYPLQTSFTMLTMPEVATWSCPVSTAARP